MTGQHERAIRTVAVYGDDIVGLSAALAFSVSLPQVAVTLVAGEPRKSLSEFACASLPEVRRFHAAVRIDERALLESGAAVHHLGTRFDGWPEGRSWVHAFGEYGVPEWPVQFHHLWVRAHQAGEAEPHHRYSAAAVLAEAGKFVHPQADWPLSTYRYAFRFDPGRYSRLLRDQAVRAGVRFAAGPLRAIERREDGGIEALALANGGSIAADLFVDCSGPAALLIGAAASAFEDWSGHFPLDRLSRRVEAGSLAPSDIVEADGDGWRWTQPLPEGTVVTRASSANHAAAEGEEGLALAYGRRPEPWVRNVVAIGESAIVVDPLHGANLHLACSAILRALELLPGRDCHPVEVAEYNRRSGQEAERVRDFLALHYLHRADSGAPPESLAHTLDQFEHRGRLPFYAEESFARDSWVAALIALGHVPRHADIVADRMAASQTKAAMRKLAAGLSALPAQIPAYPDYLRQISGRR